METKDRWREKEAVLSGITAADITAKIVELRPEYPIDDPRKRGRNNKAITKAVVDELLPDIDHGDKAWVDRHCLRSDMKLEIRAIILEMSVATEPTRL